MSEISSLNPTEIWEHFDAICQIPHGSGNEKLISDYLVDFAKKNNLEYIQDNAWNVVIYKKATPGMEDKETVIMQSHIDMVCVMDESAPYDINENGVAAYVDGDFVRAKGSTLGADNGIGVAFILGVLASTDIPHPAIEAVFTTSEEIGLDGAKILDMSLLSGKRLINIDTEEEENIVIGCAGGCRCECSFSYEPIKKSGIEVKINVNDITGGHSGVEIHKGGLNANFLMGRLLCEVSSEVDLFLENCNGGTKDNAICTDANSIVVIDKNDFDKLNSLVEEYEEYCKTAYPKTDKNVKFSVVKLGEGEFGVMSKKDFDRYALYTNMSPNGVTKMSQINPGIVESSANLGIVRVGDGQAVITHSLRSSVRKDRLWKMKKLRMLAECINADIEFRGEYPAWESKGISDFAKSIDNKYEALFGKKLNIVTIHAGLECALFYDKMPSLDAVSIGPDIFGAHTVKECVSISSVEREWKLLQEILKD